MKKNGIYIILAIAMIIGVCYYLYDINTSYDGGLIDSLLPFVFTLPLIAIGSLWRIFTGENDVQPKQKLWQKILCVVLYIIAVGMNAYYLKASRFYDLSSIILAILLVALIPCAYFDYKKGGRLLKNPILNWAVVMGGIYLIIFATVFTYVKVVSPITVEQATALVTEQYGDDAYQFFGHLDFDEFDNPIGVYWFSQRNADLDGWIEVDLLTGETSVV
ncbi:MAG: hypothetical protein R3Y09_10015 [Clostridia bacterium]